MQQCQYGSYSPYVGRRIIEEELQKDEEDGGGSILENYLDATPFACGFTENFSGRYCPQPLKE